MNQKNDVVIERDYKRLDDALVETPTHAPPLRINTCPEDWLIDGKEPAGWRTHRSALAKEAKVHASVERAKLDWLLYEAPFEVALKSPLLGRFVVKEWRRSMYLRRGRRS